MSLPKCESYWNRRSPMVQNSENQSLFNLEKPAESQGPVECSG